MVTVDGDSNVSICIRGPVMVTEDGDISICECI